MFGIIFKIKRKKKIESSLRLERIIDIKMIQIKKKQEEPKLIKHTQQEKTKADMTVKKKRGLVE